MAKFLSEQIKEILAIHENTLMKLFSSGMDRLENKIERLINENTLLKQEVESLKAGADFENKWFEEAKRDLEEMRAKNPIEEGIKLTEQKHQQPEEKISELEDRSRRNNLWLSGFTEKDEGAETWEESDNLIRDIIKRNLEMWRKDITIDRAHRTGSKINSKKRAIIVKFLNYKENDAVLNQYRPKQLWKDNIYVNEDYSERRADLRKQLFEQAKEIRQLGKSAKVVCKKLAVSRINNAT